MCITDRPSFRLRSTTLAFLWFSLLGSIACSRTLQAAQPPVAPDVPASLLQIPCADLIRQLEESQDESRLVLQLAILKRNDAPIELRATVCDELIEKFASTDSPTILGAAYCGKGRVHGDRLEFSEAVKALEIAERHARQCADINPKLFFVAHCNHAAYLNALGKRDEAVRILREAIEFAKPFGDQLDVPFAYAELGRLAEASGAIDKAFEYLQSAFDSSARQNKTRLAAQAGISIVELALSESNYELASQWVPRITPWIEQANDPQTNFLLELRRADLKRNLGDPQGAAVDIQKLIDAQPLSGNKQVSGLLYLSLAACQFASKDYQAAISAADQAAELLKSIVRSWTLTRINRLESLLALGQKEEALAGVDGLLADARIVSLHRIQLHELRSRILAGLERHDDALAALQNCRKLESRRATDHAREVTEFMKANFDGQQREVELEAAQAKQKTAEAQAALLESIADREKAGAASDRLIKNLSILFSIIALLVGLLFVRTQAKRKTALAIAQREQQLSEQLQQRLDQQAIELEEQIARRQKLELAIERKFRDEALGKLTGGVAHDFNNLLTVIVQSLDLLRSQHPTLPDESVLLLNAMNGAAESGASIVSQLMAYTRQQPLVPKPLQVTAWLTGARGMFRQIVGKSIHYFESDQSAGACICIDMAQLTTAVINLLANARDAMSASGGSIELHIRRIQLTTTSDNAWPDLPEGSYVQFEVRDTGKGMSSAELEHACEPFFTTKSPGSGTGLGLSTVLGFTRQSHGDFRLVSQPGVGTSASILLPETDQAAAPPVTLPTECQDHVRLNLLLVEDQEAVRTVLAAGLKSIGYNVTEASQADEAIEIINQSGAPNVLLSDVRMPGSMNGIQLRRWVLERFPRVRVVLMSGFHDIELSADPNMIFLQKPVKLKDLARSLKLEP